tara:strand:- start:182 stop:1018 length:837 start_codon:yes stop_codon:yes gene_type:complete
MGYELLYLGRERSQGSARWGKNHYTGKMVVTCPNNEAVAVADSLIETDFPGMSGVYAPECWNTQILYNKQLPGRAIVVCLYKTESVSGAGKPPEVGRATVTLELDGGVEKLKRDLAGVPIEAYDEGVEFYYQLIEGLPATPRPQLKVTINTAVATGDWSLDTYLAKIGKVNSGNLSVLGAAAETMLYLGPTRAEHTWGKPLIYVNHTFLYKDKGWNNWLRTTKGKWKVITIPVLDVNLLATGRTRDKKVFVPEVNVQPESSRIFLTTSFSDLDGLVQW